MDAHHHRRAGCWDQGRRSLAADGHRRVPCATPVSRRCTSPCRGGRRRSSIRVARSTGGGPCGSVTGGTPGGCSPSGWSRCAGRTSSCWACPAAASPSPPRWPGRSGRRWTSSSSGSSACPSQPELAMGAVGEGGVLVVDDRVVGLARGAPADLERPSGGSGPRWRAGCSSSARAGPASPSPAGPWSSSTTGSPPVRRPGRPAPSRGRSGRPASCSRRRSARPAASTAVAADVDELVCLRDAPETSVRSGSSTATSGRRRTPR